MFAILLLFFRKREIARTRQVFQARVTKKEREKAEEVKRDLA